MFNPFYNIQHITTGFTRCSICNILFEEDERVRDHCHFTGKYRGAAHVKCNLDYSFIPVFFHNRRKHDAHLTINKASSFDFLFV